MVESCSASVVPAVQDSGHGVNAVDASEAAVAAARLQQAAQDVAVTQQQLALLEVGGEAGQQIGQLIGKVDADVAKKVHIPVAPRPGNTARPWPIPKNNLTAEA